MRLRFASRLPSPQGGDMPSPRRTDVVSAGDEPQAAGCASGAARSGAANLREGGVSETLLRLAGPMLVGIASAFFFGLVDAFWTSLLGAHELAAMGFIMPVVFCVLSVVIGVGIGTTGVVARATGRADREAIERFATHGAALAAVITVVLAAVGLSTVDPLFTSLGASPALRATIAEYMVPWYAGAGFLVVQMTGNAALRGTGDTKTPMMLMLVSGLVNMALEDPEAEPCESMDPEKQVSIANLVTAVNNSLYGCI